MGGADGAAAASLFRGSSLSAEDFLVRESIQNSWDAARNHRRAFPNEKIPFRMVFRFVDYAGNDKLSLIESLGINELKTHFDQASTGELSEKLSNQAEDAFHLLESDQPLTVLYLEDYGTHGLYGIPTHPKSHLYKALYVFGVTGKSEGSGGSFGFGKSAFIRASRSRTVVAYSQFNPVQKGAEFENDDPVTRRAIGWSWWNQHDIQNQAFEGRAVMFQQPPSESSLPFEDDEADRVAQSIGITPRIETGHSTLGTTLALVDPVVDPERIIESVEKWWWPALIEHGLNFEIEIVKANGEVCVPRPKSNHSLKNYIHAFGLANGTDIIDETNTNEQLASKNWQKIRFQDVSLVAGTMALTCAEVSQETLIDPITGELVTPKVALIRAPRMVMKYYESPGRNLPITGVYIASEEVDSHLRATEPPAHDDWDTKSNSDIPEISTFVASSVMSKIKNSLSAFARGFQIKDSREKKPLGHFSKLLSNLMGGAPGPWPPPPPSNSPISIQYPNGVELHAEANGEISAQTTIRVGLNSAHVESHIDTPIAASFSVQYTIIEDDSPSGSTIPVTVTSTTTARATTKVTNPVSENNWLLTLKPEEEIDFIIKTASYSADWTGRFEPVVKLINTSDSEQ